MKQGKVVTEAMLPRDQFGRFADERTWVQSIKYEDLDVEIGWELALSCLLGPGWMGAVFNPNAKNIRTLEPFSSGHHAKDGAAKTRGHYIRLVCVSADQRCPHDVVAPRLTLLSCVFCVEMKTLSDAAVDICGNQFNFQSGGCTTHKRVNGWDRNNVYFKRKNKLAIVWRDVLWPSEIKRLNDQPLEEIEDESKAMENQRILAEADAEDMYAYKRFNERKRANARQVQRHDTIQEVVEPTANDLRRIKLGEKFDESKKASMSIANDDSTTRKRDQKSGASDKKRQKGRKKGYRV